MHEGYHSDAIITLGGCDKSRPYMLTTLRVDSLILWRSSFEPRRAELPQECACCRHAFG